VNVPRRPAHVALAKRHRYLPLFAKIVLANLVVLGAACLVIFIALAPNKISELAADEVLVVTLCVVTLVNVVIARRIGLPLQRLTALARTIDPAAPRERFPGAAVASEAGELAQTFNEMLDRLQRERAESARSVLAAHEAERMRVAQELHDEVGQTLTAVLLQLSRVQHRMGAKPAPELGEAQETVRASLEDVRRIASELRPETLADLGLASALVALSDTFSRRTEIEVRRNIESDLPPLTREAELAAYRIAQEALTNVARHARSASADLALTSNHAGVVLSVRDYGDGLRDASQVAGNGIRGMRERASAVSARLDIGGAPSGPGSEVRLELPAGARA
jgi:two-component system sensor histidine kinase UhpB